MSTEDMINAAINAKGGDPLANEYEASARFREHMQSLRMCYKAIKRWGKEYEDAVFSEDASATKLDTIAVARNYALWAAEEAIDLAALCDRAADITGDELEGESE